nr:MAG TPA: hypothetical protein [Caudoviricetes sp.]DAZ50451.1 MAG TPA: hypothetical protein [Caudoviricetes sp.]
MQRGYNLKASLRLQAVERQTNPSSHDERGRCEAVSYC